MVNLGGKPSIAACTEHRASLCIGVEQRKIIGTQSVDAIRIEQMVYTRQVKATANCPRFRLCFSYREQAELESALNIKQFFSILKIIERYQSVFINKFGEESLIAVIHGNAGR